VKTITYLSCVCHNQRCPGAAGIRGRAQQSSALPPDRFCLPPPDSCWPPRWLGL